MFEITFPEETRHRVLKEYDDARVVLEFGSGGSTIYGVQSPDRIIATVESDKDWLGRLVDYAEIEKFPGQLIPMYIDVGPTGEWGHPKDLSHKHKFPNYAVQPWQQLGKLGLRPDLILIDGRFRPACFLATAASIEQPARVIFDDYKERPQYHVVEEICQPSDYAGRAALFDLQPNQIRPKDLISLFDLFFKAF